MSDAWKTITLGLHKTVGAYRKALEEHGFEIGQYAETFLGKTPIARRKRKVHLVIRTLAELGFTEAERYDVICHRAKKRGFTLCPAEVVLALRLAYVDQPMCEPLVVATKALSVRDGYPILFCIGRDAGGAWLEAGPCLPDLEWNPEYSLVFVSPEP